MNANPVFAAPVAPTLDASVSRAPVTTLESFDVYCVALDACRVSVPISTALTASLRDQLVRASSSAVLNVAEGFGSFSRGVKRRHYEIARGSATECVAVLDLAVALGIVTETSEARGLFARVAMMLAKLEARFR